MSIIAMCCYDTEENGRTKYTRETLEGLIETANGHRIIVVDNNSCQDTKDLLWHYQTREAIELISLKENIGTAKAINKAWAMRLPGDHCIKIDNDVVVHSYGWVEELEEVIERDPSIGQVGLKRKDLLENPYRNDEFKSTLRMLTSLKGERWIVVEDVSGVMGTCVLHSSRLINKIGGLVQPGMYGFDDTLMSIRTKLAGFKCCFLPHIEIDHIDTGATDYTDWKRKYAGEQMNEFSNMKKGLINGSIKNYISL